MGPPLAFIEEVDSTIAQSNDLRRAAMLRHLTDLYLVGSESYSEDEMSVIDDVFMRLVAKIEESSRALLSIRLAPLAKAPRGGQNVLLSVVTNAGAQFSDRAFGHLVARAQGSDELAERVGRRPELPQHLFRQLLDAASDVVRSRLEAEKAHARHAIGEAVDEVAARIEAEALTRTPEYAAAQVLVESLSQSGLLNAAKLKEFAAAGRFEDIVAALASMANMPAEIVERSVNDTRAESLLVLARAIGLRWEATRGIIALAGQRYRRSPADIGNCIAAFQRLNPATARQILEFQRVRSPGTRHAQ